MRKVWYLFLALCVVGFAPVFAQSDDEPISMVDGKPDTDGDGIPDEWEKQYGLNPNNMFDGKMDMDGDKIKNIDEYKLKTNPTDKDVDKNKDGVADDWMKFYGFTDANADADGDGVSNKEEYEAGTNPTDANSSPKKVAKVSQKHPEPIMDGIKENIDPNIPDNHLIKPNVLKFLDPIGDDKGPGYYTYPTNPVYVPGGFDIVSFTVDASGSDNVIFQITINADVKQDWGMAADFDIQHFQIYIDQDKVPGSGNVKSIPGLNIYFDPADAWEKAVIITPQPDSRVQIEIDVKAKEMSGDIVVPIKISAQGRTFTAVVKKSDLGITPDTDITTWGWQLIAQSNEGYPDPEDILTRNVNEYRGLHRFGGGNDYWGDPELMDLLVWPAKGTLQEAKDQFAILNVWESYPDPKLDIKAVVPLIYSDATEQWAPPGGFSGFAKDLAAKIKPPAQKDKYVSDNFTFSGSVNAQWYYNLDNTSLTPAHPSSFGGGGLDITFRPDSYYDNHIYSRFTLEFYGKAFTDLVNFYARISTWWGPDAQWDYWRGNYYKETHAPQGVSIDFEAFRFQLVNPIPTVDYISIGNYEYHISAWTVGAASYPDRDKFKGVFLDGSSEVMKIVYNVAYFYPFPWLGLGWSLGDYTARDNVISGLFKFEPLSFLKVKTTGMLYSDWEYGKKDNDTGLTGLAKRFQNAAGDLDVVIDFKALNTDFGFQVQGGISQVWRGTNITSGGIIGDSGVGIPAGINDIFGFFGVGTLKMKNLFGSSINVILQGFYLHDYYSIMAGRGDYGFAARQDVFLMYGNQSASAYAQDDAKFKKWDFVMWESVGDGQWAGGTGIIEMTAGLLNIHTEFSVWGFNNTNWNKLPSGYTNGQIITHPTIPAATYTNNTLAYAMRGYFSMGYKLNIGSGLDLKLSYLFNHTMDWWPMSATSHTRDGMTGVYMFNYGFTYFSHVPKITAYYQFTKALKIGLGFEYQNDTIHDLYPGATYPDYNVQGYSLIFDLQINTPLGTIRSYVQGYISDNPRGIIWGGTHSADFRTPYIYFGNKYNILALTELDIYF
ncbi:MAG: hypothetical protein HPY53_09560 [Brevinematales bacterium]|nr:hypothetical protein [Brevinematales bacterium]